MQNKYHSLRFYSPKLQDYTSLFTLLSTCMDGLVTSLTSSRRRSCPTTAYDVGRPSTTTVPCRAPADDSPPPYGKLGTSAQCWTPDRSQSVIRRRTDALTPMNGSRRPDSSAARFSAESPMWGLAASRARSTSFVSSDWLNEKSCTQDNRTAFLSGVIIRSIHKYSYWLYFKHI